MRGAILAIGDELTCGYRLDTHSQTIARRLATVPLDVVAHLTVGDDIQAICDGLRAALRAADVVVAAGGLGPTEDDVTRQAVAGFFGRSLVEDAEAVERIRERFLRRNRAMPDRNRVQAQIPDGSQIIHNARGSAVGFYLQEDGQHLFVVPGVPYEMEGMLEGFVLPRLRELARAAHFVRRGVVKLHGPTESEVADRIQAMLSRRRNPLLGLLPHRGTITVEVVARGTTPQEAESLLLADLAYLRGAFGKSVLCQDERSLPQVVGDLLVACELTLAVAEAADGTGGLVTARVTSTEGSERWFRQGLVVGAGLSEEEVKGLSTKVRHMGGSDVGLATGSIRRPQDSLRSRPYGTMVAAVDLGGKIFCQQLTRSGDWVRVRDLVADAALGMLRLRVLDYQPQSEE